MTDKQRKNWVKYYFFIGLFIVFFASCMQSKQNDAANSGGILEPAKGNKDARGFEIVKSGNVSQLLIYDPWNRSDTFAKYVIDIKTFKNEKWAVFSTTHIGFMDALGESDRLVGSTSPDRIYNSDLRKKYADGELLRIGTDMEYNIESLHQLQPDVLIQSAFPGQKAKDARIIESGIQLIYLMEWLEPTALGRAEWIRVFGLLLGKELFADSLYNSIREEYLSLQAQIQLDDKSRPLVLIGNSFKGTWYMPGGHSYLSSLLRDAGFDYPYNKSNERGSLPLSFEVVMHDFAQAPFWINVSAKEKKDLLQEDERYGLFEAFRSGEVYSFHNRITDGIANDYWESGVVNPHIVLKDLIAISHPDLIPGYKLYYYKRLQ